MIIGDPRPSPCRFNLASLSDIEIAIIILEKKLLHSIRHILYVADDRQPYWQISYHHRSLQEPCGTEITFLEDNLFRMLRGVTDGSRILLLRVIFRINYDPSRSTHMRCTSSWQLPRSSSAQNTRYSLQQRCLCVIPTKVALIICSQRCRCLERGNILPIGRDTPT